MKKLPWLIQSSVPAHEICLRQHFAGIAFALAISLPVPASAQMSEPTKLEMRADELSGSGKYLEALPLAQRALALREQALGFDHRDVAQSLGVLGNLYRHLGRFDDAEPLFKRGLKIWEGVVSRDDPDMAAPLTNLGNLYGDKGRYADAVPFHKRALEIWEKSPGPESIHVARALSNLAILYRNLGQYSDAEPLYKRSISIREKKLGPDHREVTVALNNLANLYLSQKRYADAEPLYRRSLEVREKSLGSDHPQLATALNNLTNLYRNQERYAEALPLVDRVVASGRATASAVLPVLLNASNLLIIAPEKALDDSLNVVQRANQTSAAAAVGKLAVRLAAGNDRLAQLVRRDQDLTVETDTLEKAIIAAVAKEPAMRDTGAEQRVRDRLSAVVAEKGTLRKTFAVEFPDYAALANPLPLTVKQIQQLLSADEALVVFAFDDLGKSYVFALTRDQFHWAFVPLNSDSLSKKVAAFRSGLDVNQVGDANDTSARSRWFDLGVANDLYSALFGPVEALVSNKRRLLIVPTGALSALPFHLLVTAKPDAAVPDRLDGYRDASWLIKRQAVTILPSVASLKVLREFAKKNVDGKSLIGFGDPVFDLSAPVPSAGQRASAKVAARTLTTRAYTDFWQGAAIDRDKLARQLPRLPDTATELKSIARKLGAPSADIHLSRDASETTVKRAPLADYRIVYFATHALVAGDVKGVAEPSLVLSIPSTPTSLDDGLLTASEVAQLKLNADWVVLSACNTIAGDKPGAEALSGLARSFFYAGARALLVSHWAVDSAAATRLTTSTFEILRSNPRLGRSEALRQAMLSFLNDRSQSENAHPALWGPFVLIGEGDGQ